MKKPRVAFVIADDKNLPDARMMINSLRKFHNEEFLPLILYGQKELDEIKDEHKFYRSTPMFAKDLIDEYELVLKLDCDQIIMGNLDFIFTMKDYDVGSVFNINRVDPEKYGYISVAGIHPAEYVNCGLVSMRSKKFIDHWWRLCNEPCFHRLQYKEQDLLNILMQYGDYKIRNFDVYDPIFNYSAWHGLVSKGEWDKAEIRGKNVVIPKGKDNYPDMDILLKVIHWAGGGHEKRMNYKIFFQEEVISYIDYLVSDNTEKTKESPAQNGTKNTTK